jgi:hypothetical protein
MLTIPLAPCRPRFGILGHREDAVVGSDSGLQHGSPARSGHSTLSACAPSHEESWTRWNNGEGLSLGKASSACTCYRVEWENAQT